MAGDVSIWMPWYIRDYLADTSRLTTEQHGGYLLLIADYWMSGPLPSDDDTLARIAKMSAKSWSISGPILRAFFTLGPDGRLHHKRIEEELRKARNKRESTVGRAKKAAESRWGKSTPIDSSSMPQALHEDLLADAPSPSQNTTTREAPAKDHRANVGGRNSLRRAPRNAGDSSPAPTPTREEVFARLEGFRRGRKWKEVAADLAFDERYFSDMRHGRKPLGPKLLAGLGFFCSAGSRQAN